MQILGLHLLKGLHRNRRSDNKNALAGELRAAPWRGLARSALGKATETSRLWLQQERLTQERRWLLQTAPEGRISVLGKSTR